MARNIFTTLVILSCFSYNFQANCQEALNEHLLNIHAVLKQAMTCHGMSHLSYAVVSGESTVSGTFRLSRDGSHVPEAPDRQFCLGSLTKAFTAAVVGLLRSEFSFDYDTKITDMLREEAFSDAALNDQITIRDILSHRTGLDAFHNLIFFGNEITSRNQLSEKVSFLQGKPGEFRNSYRYNNLLYAFLGHVLEKATGETWEELVRRLILRKLNMTSTVFLHELPGSHRIVDSYLYSGGEWLTVPQSRYLPLDVFGPAISICSNSWDMVSWLTFMLNSPLRNELFEYGINLQRPPNEAFTKGNLNLDYSSLGWQGGFYRGERLMYHGGFLYGYQSSIWLLPDLKIGIYLATNGAMSAQTDTILAHISESIATRILGFSQSVLSHPCRVPIQHYMPFCKCTKPVQTHSFEGWYSHPIVGVMQIYDNNGALEMAFGRHGRAVLCHLDGIRFGVMVMGYESKYFPYCEKCRFPGFCEFESYFLFSEGRAVASGIIVPFLEPDNSPIFRRMNQASISPFER